MLIGRRKKVIKEIIRDDFSYKLGGVEREQEREFKMFLFMVVGSIVAGLLLWLTDFLDEVPREIFVVLFWFFGDRMFEYAFITGYELRKERRLAGRLASINLRWHAPEPLKPSDKTFDAKKFRRGGFSVGGSVDSLYNGSKFAAATPITSRFLVKVQAQFQPCC